MSSSTTNATSCVFCGKECKTSDSRPYPSSKSKDRIHNKCLIKKTLINKKQPIFDKTITVTDEVSERPIEVTKTDACLSLIDRVTKEESNITKAINAKKMNKLLETNESQERKKDGKSSGQFFFDLKAGIAKPHEKRQYLHHRNLSEIAARYDDNGFQDEAVGRAYDHTGKDLNTLSDDSDKDDDKTSKCKNHNDKSFDFKEKVKELGRKKRNHEEDIDRTEKRHMKIKVDEQNPCWFCLSSPQVEKHLILAIGDYCYLTLAKGGLFDDHLLILPIEHIESLNSDTNSKELLEELHKFKQSLVSYFKSISKAVIFFERNFRSVHWQLQVVPIPFDIIDTIESDIKKVSKKFFKNSNYMDIPDNCTIRDMIPPNLPYFYWQLEPNGSRFVTQIQVKGSFFPIQFGRLVLTDSSILNCPGKVDWKACAKTKEDYIDLVRKTKETYRDFDMT